MSDQVDTLYGATSQAQYEAASKALELGRAFWAALAADDDDALREMHIIGPPSRLRGAFGLTAEWCRRMITSCTVEPYTEAGYYKVVCFPRRPTTSPGAFLASAQAVPLFKDFSLIVGPMAHGLGVVGNSEDLGRFGEISGQIEVIPPSPYPTA